MDWQDKSLLITGATGSFGRKFIEIVRRELKPRKVIVFSRDELKQHEMRVAGFDGDDMRYFLGDVRDATNRLERALGHRVEVDPPLVRLLDVGTP